jgi:hypothetical protein
LHGRYIILNLKNQMFGGVFLPQQTDCDGGEREQVSVTLVVSAIMMQLIAQESCSSLLCRAYDLFT